MTQPARPTPHLPAIASVISNAGTYEVTLQDGTLLWIPKVENNEDCVNVQAWAAVNNVSL